MAKAEKKLTPNQQAERHPKKWPWGRRADGTPRSKPGRKPEAKKAKAKS